MRMTFKVMRQDEITRGVIYIQKRRYNGKMSCFTAGTLISFPLWRVVILTTSHFLKLTRTPGFSCMDATGFMLVSECELCWPSIYWLFLSTNTTFFLHYLSHCGCMLRELSNNCAHHKEIMLQKKETKINVHSHHFPRT